MTAEPDRPAEPNRQAEPDRPAAGLLRLVLLGAIIGIPAALIAFAFFGLVHLLQEALWTELPHSLGVEQPPWYLVIGLPVVGALVVAVARLALPGDGGPSPLAGIQHGATPVRYAPGIALAALGTLGFGLVLGPEAPVIALGSAVGVAMTNLARPDPRGGAVLATAGSFSAISALFGGPIIAGVLLTEGGAGLGARLIPTLVPGFVAAAVGYLIFTGLGPLTELPAPGLTVPNLEVYPGTSLADLAIAIAVGAAAAVVISLVNRGARGLGLTGGRFGASRAGTTAFLLAGGLGVGLLAMLAAQLGGSSKDVLFSGQASIPTLVAETSLTVLVVLLVAKALAYVLSLASGFRGGPIFPAVFLGVGLAAFAVQLFALSATAAVAIGTAAGMAAQTRLVLSPILFSALLVGTAGARAIPAVVLASVAAYLTANALDRQADPEPAART